MCVALYAIWGKRNEKVGRTVTPSPVEEPVSDTDGGSLSEDALGSL